MTPEPDKAPARLTLPLSKDAQITFIGHIASPWSKGDCPKNLREARATGRGAQLHVARPFRPALDGITPGMALIVLYWLDNAPRDLLLQHPAHRSEPTGTFALRSPARPNPIGMGVVRCTGITRQSGVIMIDAIDAFDGTPLLDIKPWLPGPDIPAGQDGSQATPARSA